MLTTFQAFYRDPALKSWQTLLPVIVSTQLLASALRLLLKQSGDGLHSDVCGFALHTTILGRSPYSYSRQCMRNMPIFSSVAPLNKRQAIYAIGASMNGIANIKNLDVPSVAVLEWEG